MDEEAEGLSFLGGRLPPGFEIRTVAIAAGREHAHDDADWRDALVVVERGEIELECLGGVGGVGGVGGTRLRFARGDALWLSGLPLRALHNRGGEPAVLVAVSRSEPNPDSIATAQLLT